MPSINKGYKKSVFILDMNLWYIALYAADTPITERLVSGTNTTFWIFQTYLASDYYKCQHKFKNISVINFFWVKEEILVLIYFIKCSLWKSLEKLTN